METLLIFKNLKDFPSANVLLRKHWSFRDTLKTSLSWQIKQQTKDKHPGKVKIEFYRFAVQLQDWDNHCSSFKCCGDALTACQVLTDDKPDIVVEFIPKQEKVKKKELERIAVRITSLPIKSIF